MSLHGATFDDLLASQAVLLFIPALLLSAVLVCVAKGNKITYPALFKALLPPPLSSSISARQLTRPQLLWEGGHV